MKNEDYHKNYFWNFSKVNNFPSLFVALHKATQSKDLNYVLNFYYSLSVRPHLQRVDQLRDMENAAQPEDPVLAALQRWAAADASSSSPTTSTSTPPAASASASRPSAPSTSASRPSASTASRAETAVILVEDEVKREHSLKGSLDAKVKGTSLPAIEVSVSWNNASRNSSEARLNTRLSDPYH